MTPGDRPTIVPAAMNTFFPLILCISVLQAAETPTPADRGPSHGKVLVLENDQTLAGDIERAGDLYRVRRLIGETTVPAERILGFAPTWKRPTPSCEAAPIWPTPTNICAWASGAG